LSKSTDNYYPEGVAEDQPISWQTLYVDYNFVDMLKIKLVQGRDFSREFTTDPTEAVILNEAAVRQLGWKDPLGKQIRTQVFLAPPFVTGKQQDDLETVQVIGVVQDFHTESLYHQIEPLVLRMHLNQEPTTTVPIGRNSLSYILVKVKPGDLRNTLTFIQEQWNRYTGGKAFDYFFLNEEFERGYREDVRLSQLFGVSALLSVFVACLGLFGLAAFTAEQRTKEIGIRKVLGASIFSIVALLSKEFTYLVLAANLIAWPIAWYAMHRWLQSFAYRIELGLGVFVLGGVLVLGIAWLTVSYQAIRAARANPVEALRYE
jgi:putative ABC transport system permease protein